MLALLFIAGAYLVGSIPFAVLVSLAMKLPDPRSYGSNNPGATNVLRSGNKTAAALTLLGDALKGWLAVILAHHFLMAQYWAVFLERIAAISASMVAIAVFLGHVFPIFLKFKGGKGVATALGVLLALNPIMALVALGVWLVMAAALRYSSVAAITASVVASGYALFSPVMSGWYVFATLVLTGLLIWRHVPNIKNLIAGKEGKIGEKKKMPPAKKKMAKVTVKKEQ